MSGRREQSPREGRTRPDTPKIGTHAPWGNRGPAHSLSGCVIPRYVQKGLKTVRGEGGGTAGRSRRGADAAGSPAPPPRPPRCAPADAHLPLRSSLPRAFPELPSLAASQPCETETETETKT